MKITLRRDSRGMAHMVILVAVIVIVVIGGVGYSVMKSRDDKKTTVSTSTDLATAKEATSRCLKNLGDKDICKFNSAHNGEFSYTASFITVDKDGKSNTFVINREGKGNSSTVTSENGKETGAFISLDGDYYIKDFSDNTWTKYPKTDQTANVATDSEITKNLVLDDGEIPLPDDKRITYKKLGKEACGKDTCFKYQVIDPAAPNTESIIWFGTTDYQLHKWSFKDTDGSTNIGTFTYTDVTIKAPTPVKEASDVPSAADIQRMLEDAQASSSDDSGN